MIFIDYDFPNWNDYINAERSNKFKAAKMKKTEADIMRYFLLNVPKVEEYPIEITFKWHFKDFRKDLDNVRPKSLIDSLVKYEILKNDNLNCIRKITHESIIDGKTGVEIEFKTFKGE